MSLLGKAIVDILLDKAPKYKQEVIEDLIRQLLGAEPIGADRISFLQTRRGLSDGRIDGLLEVYRKNQNKNTYKVQAGINIKVRKACFNPDQLGGFILALERQSLNTGLIITATGLCPDSKVELDKVVNARPGWLVQHIYLERFIDGDLPGQEISFPEESLPERVRGNMTRLLQNFAD